MKEIILASASPRRKEILEKAGFSFRVDASGDDEKLDNSKDPHELAQELAVQKAKSVAVKHRNSLIIAADTFVILEGFFLGKPSSPEDAKRMLRLLSGKTHVVVTGYAIIDSESGRVSSGSEETEVTFRELSEPEIESYVCSGGESLDKAGGYAVQGLGSVIVKKIKGDYYNVMGLPVCALSERLKEFGVHVLK